MTAPKFYAYATTSAPVCGASHGAYVSLEPTIWPAPVIPDGEGWELLTAQTITAPSLRCVWTWRREVVRLATPTESTEPPAGGCRCSCATPWRSLIRMTVGSLQTDREPVATASAALVPAPGSAAVITSTWTFSRAVPSGSTTQPSCHGTWLTVARSTSQRRMA